MAVGSRAAMTYSPETRTWSAEVDLRSGALRFETIPVTSGDPTFELGLSSGISELAAGGEDIQVAESGTYDIMLELSNPPYYTYKIIKK